MNEQDIVEQLECVGSYIVGATKFRDAGFRAREVCRNASDTITTLRTQLAEAKAAYETQCAGTMSRMQENQTLKQRAERAEADNARLREELEKERAKPKVDLENFTVQPFVLEADEDTPEAAQ